MRENGAWSLFDGVDGSSAAVASGTGAEPGYRTVLLDITDSGSAVTVKLSIDGDLQASHTLTGSFAGNYMAFSAYTDAAQVHSTYFDNFSIVTLPPLPPGGTLFKFK